MNIVVLSGGVGGARFVRGLLKWREDNQPGATITVIANTGDDMWMHGLRICPDLDTLMYTLGGVVHEEQGWGRTEESFTVAEELRAYGAGGEWFTLGDKDLATHLARTSMLSIGATLSEATARLMARWNVPVTVLPMSDQSVETNVELRDGSVIHFEQWWVRLRAAEPAVRFIQRGVEHAVPAPGVLDAIKAADVIVVPPSNPVVSVGTILGVPGMAAALKRSRAPMVGVSGLIGGQAVRGMANACLETIGVESSAAAVAIDYRERYGLMDAWLVDTVDEPELPRLREAGLAAIARPLWMTSVEETAAIAADALALARTVSG